MDILDCQIGMVVTNDPTEGNVFADQFQDFLHCNAGASHTWFPKVNPRINGDSVHWTLATFLQQLDRTDSQDRSARNTPWLAILAPRTTGIKPPTPLPPDGKWGRGFNAC